MRDRVLMTVTVIACTAGLALSMRSGAEAQTARPDVFGVWDPMAGAAAGRSS